MAARKGKKKPAKKRKKPRKRATPAKKSRPRRKTKTSKKTRPRRKPRKKKSDLADKLKMVIAGGLGAGVGALAGPSVQALTKQTGITGEIIAGAVPLAAGALLHHQGVTGFGGGMAAMGAGLLLLSGFRRIKSKIPGLDQIDMGPLGDRVPKIYSNAGSNRLLIRGNDGVLHPVPQTGDFGKRKTVLLPDGQRVTGQSLGVANINGENYMPLYLPSKGELKLIRLGGTVARSEALGDGGQMGGAVARNEAFAGAVSRSDAFGKPGSSSRRQRLTTGYNRSSY